MRNEFRAWPKQDTITAKRKIVREVRRIVRTHNRETMKLFGNRFTARITQQQIRPYPDNSGWDAYFQITYHDAEQPQRDYSFWYDEHFIKYSGFFSGGNHFDTDFNNFIAKGNKCNE